MKNYLAKYFYNGVKQFTVIKNAINQEYAITCLRHKYKGCTDISIVNLNEDEN